VRLAAAAGAYLPSMVPSSELYTRMVLSSDATSKRAPLRSKQHLQAAAVSAV